MPSRVWTTILYCVFAINSNFDFQASPPEEHPARSEHPPIAVNFHLRRDSYVSLVIENLDGFRVKNLVAEQWFPAGENTVWWDGTDDLGRDPDAPKHGVYRLPSRFVAPGEYNVRGIFRGKIEPHYEFSVYSPGDPPWSTENSKGGWLANHSPPQAALFVPAESSPTKNAAILLGSYVTEGPAGLAWVDLEGNKRGGKKWIGGNWTGAPFLARDIGANSDREVYAYVASTWNSNNKIEIRVTALTPAREISVLNEQLDKIASPIPFLISRRPESEIGGISVYNGTMAVSLFLRSRLFFIDIRSRRISGSMNISAPKGIAYDSKGNLLILSEGKLLRLPNGQNIPEVLINSGLEDPTGIALDNEGLIYITNRGTSHQVRIFTSKGSFIRAIGERGTPGTGPYNPLRMNSPAGLTIDSNQRIWVTEKNFLPKRVSVWSNRGELLKAFYGPGKYGGGGTLDPVDKTKFYYADGIHGAMEFKLDWSKGNATIERIYYRPGPADLQLPPRSKAPETAIYCNGKRYFTNCYNNSPTGGSNVAFIFSDEGPEVRPIVAAGRANDWDILKGTEFKDRRLAVKNSSGDSSSSMFFIWSDLNTDTSVEPNEVSFLSGESGGVTVMPDLSICVARLGKDAAKFEPEGFTKKGTPFYRISSGEKFASGVLKPQSSGGNQALVFNDDSSAITLGIAPFHQTSLSGAKHGVPRWSYPTLWPGLHASHSAPKPSHEGMLVGNTRLLGGAFSVPGTNAGPFWAINQNNGQISIFTSDGILVTTLFKDMREGKPWRMPVASRNMPLSDVSLGEENFWPTITGNPDGSVYMVDGNRSAIVRLDGLDSIQTLSQTSLTVSTQHLRDCLAWQIEVESRRQVEVESHELRVPILAEPPVVDGNLDEWKTSDWAIIDKSGVKAYFNAKTLPYDIKASLAIAKGHLYAAWQTDDSDLLQNSGELPLAPFKTGGALDLMLGTNADSPPNRSEPVPGDLRLLTTTRKGKPYALLYSSVITGTPESEKTPFSSPLGTVYFDKITDVTKSVQFGARDGCFEISVPLSTLGLSAVQGKKIKGDIGILRGYESETIARTYWNNKSTGLTSDIPSEAALQPSLWGTFLFESLPHSNPRN